MFELRSKNDLRQAYVENIKAHAFVPNKYLENYFDFLFSFYDRNLLRNLTEDIDEDIDDLISFVSDSLNKSGDEVSIEKSGSKPAKSYKLLKATRSLIAQSGSTVLSDIFFDHLVMMDDYYYDGKLPSKSNRFTEEFQKWVEKKNSEINNIIFKRFVPIHLATLKSSQFSRHIYYKKYGKEKREHIREKGKDCYYCTSDC
jgi:hypothetical protein